jgi:hypothetical protein
MRCFGGTPPSGPTREYKPRLGNWKRLHPIAFAIPAITRLIRLACSGQAASLRHSLLATVERRASGRCAGFLKDATVL